MEGTRRRVSDGQGRLASGAVAALGEVGPVGVARLTHGDRGREMGRRGTGVERDRGGEGPGRRGIGGRGTGAKRDQGGEGPGRGGVGEGPERGGWDGTKGPGARAEIGAGQGVRGGERSRSTSMSRRTAGGPPSESKRMERCGCPSSTATFKLVVVSILRGGAGGSGRGRDLPRRPLRPSWGLGVGLGAVADT